MLVDHFKNGDIPKQASTFQEEQGRIAFETGKLLFLRNWPYVYNLAKTEASSKVKDKFGVAPLPGVNGPGASSLGGHNAAISTYCDHKRRRSDFLKFIDELGARRSSSSSRARWRRCPGGPVQRPQLIKKLPYLPMLKKSIANAVPGR